MLSALKFLTRQTAFQMLPKQCLHLIASRGALLVSVCLAGSFCLLLLWLHKTDFYNKEFCSHGHLVTKYQVARFAMIPAMAWLIYAMGAGVTALLCGRNIHIAIQTYERYPLYFFIGAGVWQCAFFIVGSSGLYTWNVAVILSIAILILSIPTQ